MYTTKYYDGKKRPQAVIKIILLNSLQSFVQVAQWIEQGTQSQEDLN